MLITWTGARAVTCATAISLLAMTAHDAMAQSIEGTASDRERIALPSSAVFEAVLKDVSRADAPAETIASTRVVSPGDRMAMFSATAQGAAALPSSGLAGTSWQLVKIPKHWICVFSLVAIFATGYVGYFAVDAVWPQFYYAPVAQGKSVWLIMQLACIVLFALGVMIAFADIRRASHAVAATST